jgi:hypothetical protein
VPGVVDQLPPDRANRRGLLAALESSLERIAANALLLT